jgi:hypothetical protein
MKEFKEWLVLLEELELKTIDEPDISKKDDSYWKIWGFKGSNKQGVDKWVRDYTTKTFQYPLNKERFIHFAPKSVIPIIVQENKIRGRNGATFAVSTSFGKYVPQVQFRVKGKGRAGAPVGFQKEDTIGAVIFKTSTKPVQAKEDEVIWDGNSVDIVDAKEISHRLAIAMLKHTLYGHMLKWNDSVEYV